MTAEPTRGPQTDGEQLLWEVCDLVSLWKNGVIKGLPRADRNAAIESTRERIIKLVDAGAAVQAVNERDALIAALTKAERCLAAMHKDGWKVGGDLITEIRSALSGAAKGERG